MLCEHEMLNHNNLICLFCFGRHSCPLEFDTLEERMNSEIENNFKGKFLSPEPKLCSSSLLLCVVLFIVLYVPASAALTTPLHYSFGTDLPVCLRLLFPPGALY